MSQPTGVAADGAKHYLGKGAVYFDPFDANGNRTGERFLGNCSGFEISMSEDTVEKYSYVDSSAGLVARVPIKRTAELSVTMDEFDEFNLKTAFLGNSGTETNGSGTLTAEAINNVLQGRWYALSKRNVSAVSVKGAGGTPTYVLGTDYDVDAAVGRIYIIEGGAIADASDIEVGATYAAETNTLVYGGAAGVVRGYFRFVSDPPNGPTIETEIWQATVEPDGALALIGDDFGEFKFKGAILSDAVNHPTEPWFRVRIRG